MRGRLLVLNFASSTYKTTTSLKNLQLGNSCLFVQKSVSIFWHTLSGSLQSWDLSSARRFLSELCDRSKSILDYIIVQGHISYIWWLKFESHLMDLYQIRTVEPLFLRYCRKGWSPYVCKKFFISGSVSAIFLLRERYQCLYGMLMFSL